jgi:hypothetical protein
MPTRDISCAYCGMRGKIEIWGINDDIRQSEVFKYKGHNPLSGHMHFQCPRCNIVSLINPLSVLGSDMILADINPTGDKEERKSVFFHIYKLMTYNNLFSLRSASKVA